jgi:hypothetical protein
MNKNYFNGKYNLILCTEYILPRLPENVIVRRGKLEDIALTIRHEELNNDEVFSGHIIINNNFKKIDFASIFKIKLDDNTLYTTDFKHTPYHHKCICENTLMYCSSFVLWILGNRQRTKNSLYGICRSHRIRLKKLTGFEI